MSRASVTVDGVVVAAINHGSSVLVGVAAGDGAADIAYVAAKIRDLRVFPDDAGRMNRSVVDTGGQRPRRVAVHPARRHTEGASAGVRRRGAPDRGTTGLRRAPIETLHSSGVPVASGRFQAHMAVALVNDGPVTLLVDSRKLF